MGFFGQLPKPGSVNTGPAPAAPPGGWPAFKGTAGPKQQQCTVKGGSWIGPAGKKWCQISPKTVPVPAAPGVTPAPAPAPVDNALVPVGDSVAPPGLPFWSETPGVEDFNTGAVTMSMQTSAPKTGSSTGTLLILLAGLGGVVFLLTRNKKKAAVAKKHGDAQTAAAGLWGQDLGGE